MDSITPWVESTGLEAGEGSVVFACSLLEALLVQAFRNTEAERAAMQRADRALFII